MTRTYKLLSSFCVLYLLLAGNALAIAGPPVLPTAAISQNTATITASSVPAPPPPASPPTTPTEFGAEANPTGNPLGGGVGYSRILLTGNYIVATADQFLSALRRAQPGEVVYLQPQAEIDLTGLANIEIPAGVTIAGNRGYAGSAGPIIYSNQLNTFPLFNASGPKVRLTGIRLRGPDPAQPDSIALRIIGSNGEVDNCEIWNWSYAGIAMIRAKDAYIHHNFIHDVRRPGLGYPVVFDTATGLVEANIFDYYRHAIAGTGTKGTGYEARYNLVLGNAIGHAFDMHGGTDYCPTKKNVNCTDQDILMAGDYVNIHHNTFLITSFDAIRIRGVARDYVDIHHNWFIDPDPAKAVHYRYYSGGNANVYQNVFGSEKQLIAVSIQPSPFIFPEASQTIVGLADGGKVSFGFASPMPNATEPLRGHVPLTMLPVQVDTSIGLPLQINKVEIRLDEILIYQGNKLPQPGEIMLNTLQVPDGTYQLALEIGTNLGFPLKQTLPIQINNRWILTDQLLAPANSGWFGIIDNARTSAVSEGWAYATDNAANFWADESRRVRTRTTEEFLVWETPRLQKFKTIIYVRTTNASNFTTAVSANQTSWRSIASEMQVTGPNEAGWYRLEISGTIPQNETVHWFRLTLNNGANPADMQVGEIEFQGLN